MITEVPAVTPVTSPVTEFTFVFALLLLQAPPARASLRDVVSPSHTVGVPEIADGAAFTVTTVDTEQPVGSA